MDSVALHIPVCFENIPKITDTRRVLEIECLKKRVKEIKVPMYISINGECDQRWIDRVYRIAAQPGTFVKEVFHRKNIGYQWGGFYDMFKKLTFEDNHWTHFATLEVDCSLRPDWLEKCLKPDQQHIGMVPYRRKISPLHFPANWKYSVREDHTRGGFHFCRKVLLEKIDKRFGCFTHAKGSDLVIDGILHGEVGFCSKIDAVGAALHAVGDVCYVDIIRHTKPEKIGVKVPDSVKKDLQTREPVKLPSSEKKDKEKARRLEKAKRRELEKKKNKNKRKRRRLEPVPDVQNVEEKPKKPEKKREIIIPQKISRYRSERNKLNANVEKGRFRLGR